MEEVRIRIELADKGQIKIINNDECLLEINADSKMTINGEEIFKTLNYSTNKKYVLEKLDDNHDEALKRKYEATQKLHKFYEDLLSDINKLNLDDDLTRSIDEFE
jgi:hypothetical protein